MAIKKSIAALAALILMSLTLSACGFNYGWFLHAGSGSEPQEEQAIRAEVNSEFVITLDSNRTTGYQWQLAGPLDDNLLKLVKSEYVAPTTKLVGAAGKELWVFKPLAPGRAVIYFKYVRPWEKDVPAVTEKSFIVSIK